MNARAGVFAASITPFNRDLSVDVGALKAHVDWLFENGADGVALLGTTGEANSIGVNERLALIEDIADCWPGERVLLGVGTPAIADTVALIHAAIDYELSNVLMLPPFYYKGVSDEGLFQVWVEVLKRVGPKPVGIYVYDFPAMVGFPLHTDLIARLHERFPDRVVGMKDSSGDYDKMKDVLGAVPGFRVYAGTEELLLPILKAGGVGCVSATVNVTVREAAEVWRLWQAGDRPAAEAAQTRLTAIRQALQRWPMVPALKAVLRQHFPDHAGQTIRPPLVQLSDSERERLLKELDEIGFRVGG